MAAASDAVGAPCRVRLALRQPFVERRLRIVDGAPAITQIDLKTVGVVPGVDDETFQKTAGEAKAGCPVSKALAGVPEINLEASLEN